MFTHINIYTYTSISLTKKCTLAHALSLPTPPKGRCTSWWQQHRACSNLPGNDVTTRLQVQLGRTGTCTEEKNLLSSLFSLSLQLHASFVATLSLCDLWTLMSARFLQNIFPIYCCKRLPTVWAVASFFGVAGGGGWGRPCWPPCYLWMNQESARFCYFCWSWLKYFLMWKCQILP